MSLKNALVYISRVHFITLRFSFLIAYSMVSECLQVPALRPHPSLAEHNLSMQQPPAAHTSHPAHTAAAAHTALPAAAALMAHTTAAHTLPATKELPPVTTLQQHLQVIGHSAFSRYYSGIKLNFYGRFHQNVEPVHCLIQRVILPKILTRMKTFNKFFNKFQQSPHTIDSKWQPSHFQHQTAAEAAAMSQQPASLEPPQLSQQYPVTTIPQPVFTVPQQSLPEQGKNLSSCGICMYHVPV